MFAWQAVCEVEPEQKANVLELGAAWLDAGDPAEALRCADAVLKDWPVDGVAQDLMRRASLAQTDSKTFSAAAGPLARHGIADAGYSRNSS